MLFHKRYWEGIRSGAVTLTYRRWKRRQATAGRRYRTAAGTIEVDAVDVVHAAAITASDARRAGHESVEALLRALPPEDDVPLYRVAFRYVDEPDPRNLLAAEDTLTAEDVAAIDRRLQRLDTASATGAWVFQTLQLIEERPSVRAADLAEALGRPRAAFKRDVRKLKNLGLTESLDVGYRLSPRGKAYLRRTALP